jgi:hypothetical protein
MTGDFDSREAAKVRDAYSKIIPEISKYCAPLFVIDSLAVSGFADLSNFPMADSENGTVTFISFERETYAVTANHLIDLLRKSGKAHGEYLFTPLLGIRGNTKIDFHVPSFPDDFRQPEVSYPAPDVALCRITSKFLEEIGKTAFSFDATQTIARRSPSLLVIRPTRSSTLRMTPYVAAWASNV